MQVRLMWHRINSQPVRLQPTSMYPASAGTTIPRTRAEIAGNEPIFQELRFCYCEELISCELFAIVASSRIKRATRNPGNKLIIDPDDQDESCSACFVTGAGEKMLEGTERRSVSSGNVV